MNHLTLIPSVSHSSRDLKPVLLKVSLRITWWIFLKCRFSFTRHAGREGKNQRLCICKKLPDDADVRIILGVSLEIFSPPRFLVCNGPNYYLTSTENCIKKHKNYYAGIYMLASTKTKIYPNLTYYN